MQVNEPIELRYDLTDTSFVQLNNKGTGPSIYWVVSPDSPAMKVEMVFAAGSRFQEQSFVAKTTVDNLFTGTSNQSAAELDEAFDLLGAYYSGQSGRDNIYVSGYVLEPQFEQTLELLNSVIQGAVFPADLLQLSIDNGRKEFLSQQKKAEWLAKRRFYGAYLREGHQLSKLSQLADYDHLTVEKVQAFHRSYIAPGPVAVFISGPANTGLQIATIKAFSQWGSSNGFLDPCQVTDQDVKGQGQLIVEPGPGLQDAVHVGKTIHYADVRERLTVQLLGLALGGYFGSRLMQNIREDKGWTYGISSRLDPFGDRELLAIRSSVKSGKGKLTVDEIFKELNRLISEPIAAEELKTLKNTMFGQFQRMIDGPLRQLDALSYLLRSKLSPLHFHEMLQLLKGVTVLDLQRVAAEKLQPASFLSIVIEGQESP